MKTQLPAFKFQNILSYKRLVFIFLICTSCSSQKEPINDYPLSFTINEDYNTTNNTIATLDNRGITIDGTCDNGNSISIHINGLDAGTYLTESHSFNFTNIIFQNSESSYVSFSNNPFIGGAIEIHQLDTVDGVLNGSFEATLVSEETTLEISDGIFNDLPLSNNYYLLKADFQGSIDDQLFAPTRISASKSDQSIVINFLKDNMELIEITLPDEISEGEFSLGGLDATYIASYSYLADDYLANDGSITIGYHDLANQILYGSFNFTGTLIGEKATVDVICTEFAVSYF